ncbi:hypothetical protein MNEG_8917 [Monoraphidium neglectum]|uniref:Uncharacterized protein n=1 Tax=Monoraphidium neglectum TaxID=145388 RepID=A0A0D2JI59_9CHLO|nr:hypothetical protein MNEG_8917 [Monoraphidium neglectum]KIY99042.1 hypothetical protein MNEG_8917 [Monoraphidium neglectum]|eukprot:XP_013898062.1 hypothetical protein MNEG_8917 [Monoraphidium neglectum]
MDAASQTVAKASGDDLARALTLLAAVVDGCDTAALLHRLPVWVPLLGEALRRACTKQPNAAAPARADAPPAGAAAAACRALASLYRRLQPLMELPGVRREAVAGVSRALQLLLPVLSAPLEGGGGAAAEALELLRLLMEVAPASLRQHQAALSAQLPKLLRAAAAAVGAAPAGAPGAQARALLARAAACVALLPRLAGDAAAWSEGARGLLVSCHAVLDFMTMGLEGPQADPHARALLARPGSAAAGQQQQQQEHMGRR